MMRIGPATLVLLLLIPTVGAQGGGTVVNAPPSVESASQVVPGDKKVGNADDFIGVVHDANGESDIRAVRLSTVSGPMVLSLRNISASDLSNTTEPTGFDDGWKVWNEVADDGRLQVMAQHVYSQPGKYRLAVGVRDEGASFADSTNISVQVTPAKKTSGGGGGNPPPPQDPPPDNPPPSQDSDQDGVADEAEEDLGTDPHRPDSTPSFDLTDRTQIRRVGFDVFLTWQRIDQAFGYQLFRRTSPWALIATLDSNATGFVDRGMAAPAQYRVTFFVGNTSAHGYIDDASQLEEAPGMPSAAGAYIGPATQLPETIESGPPMWPEASYGLGTGWAGIIVLGLVAALLLAYAHPHLVPKRFGQRRRGRD